MIYLVLIRVVAFVGQEFLSDVFNPNPMYKYMLKMVTMTDNGYMFCGHAFEFSCTPDNDGFSLG